MTSKLVSTIFFVFIIPAITFGQLREGRVVSSQTDQGIGFVNIGVVGKNIGTVSDQNGNFRIVIDSIYNKDSVRFSVIGYEPQTFPVRRLNDLPDKTLYLNPLEFYLSEIKVIYSKPREIQLGYPVTSDALRSGFSDNDLGSELGVIINTRKRVRLKDLNLNVGVCTYDSVSYRVNIYEVINQTEFKNILTKPIYISFSNKKINEALTFDLWENSIIAEGDILVTLELFKNLGEGRLLFKTEFFTGYTYHRKTSQGLWTKAPGAVGLYLTGRVIK
jgi:hypothetical protein